MNNQYGNSPAPVKNGKGLSIAGMVCGIVACVLAWFYMINIVALVLGIVGIVCASTGRKQAKLASTGTGIGTAGLVLSIIGTVLAGIGFLSCTLCVLCAAEAVSSTSGLWG
ncbi:MAG: hypothetical protein ACI3YH_07985 [Eubacteriales bacterium]